MTTEIEANGPTPEVMWTLSQIAERDGVAKPTVSIHVKRLVERHNLTVTRDHLGRVSLVNVVEYDTLRERYADPSKAQASRPDPIEPAEDVEGLPPARTPAKPARDSYEEAKRVSAWFEVEKRRLDAAELRGLLIRRDAYEAAVGACAAELVRLIDLLPQEADKLAVELDFDDVHRVRLGLKGLARRLRESLSKAFEVLQAGAPALDPALDEFTGPEGEGE